MLWAPTVSCLTVGCVAPAASARLLSLRFLCQKVLDFRWYLYLVNHFIVQMKQKNYTEDAPMVTIKSLAQYKKYSTNKKHNHLSSWWKHKHFKVYRSKNAPTTDRFCNISRLHAYTRQYVSRGVRVGETGRRTDDGDVTGGSYSEDGSSGRLK